MKRQTQTVDCPKSMVGRVIGKNGETIKALQTYTGALIQIDQTCDPTKVTISGTTHSLNLAVSMVSDIVKGTFKGFALLRQLGHPLDLRQPGVSAPRPVYAPGYGLIPPNQLYGTDVRYSGANQLPLGDRPGMMPMAWPQGATPNPLMLQAGQLGGMMMRPGLAGGLVPMMPAGGMAGQRPEEVGLLGFAPAAALSSYMYSPDQLGGLQGAVEAGYPGGMLGQMGGPVGATARMYGAAGGGIAGLAGGSNWTGGAAGGGGSEAIGAAAGGRSAGLGAGAAGGPGLAGPSAGAPPGIGLVPMMDASGAMFYVEPGAAPGGAGSSGP